MSLGQYGEWQRCPICAGSGRLWDTLMPTQTVACHGCGGSGMIARPRFAGLPPDLARVLSDPTVTIERDREITMPDGRSLWEHLQEWRNAPSNTASAD